MAMTPEELMRAVTRGIANNDLRPLMDAVDDKTVWKSAAAEGPFRFAGIYRARTGVAEVTSNIFAEYTFERFEPKEIVSSGEIVWGLFDAACRYRPARNPDAAPKAVRFEVAMRLRVKVDKIVEYQTFFDTASLLRQQGGVA